MPSKVNKTVMTIRVYFYVYILLNSNLDCDLWNKFYIKFSFDSPECFPIKMKDKFACTIAVLFLLDYPIRFYQFVIIVLYWRVHLYYDGKAIANFKLFQIFWVHTCTWGELENFKQLESALLSSSINPLFSFTGVYNYFYDVKTKAHVKLPEILWGHTCN